MPVRMLHNIEERIYPSYKINVIVSYMKAHGFPPDLILAGTQLSELEVSSPETFISLSQLTTVFRNVIRHSKDPAVALKIGKTLKISDYGLYGYVLLCSTSLRKALMFAIEYHKLATPSVEFSLEEHEDYTAFITRDTLYDSDLHFFNLEHQFSVQYALFRDMLGSDAACLSVHIEFPRPAHFHEYPILTGCPVIFDEPRTEFRLANDILDQPLLRSNAITEQMVIEMCDKMLKEQSSRSGIVGKIHNMLINNSANLPTSAEVAALLSITPRTLRRKLEAHGTSYRNIVDDIRKVISIECLRKTKMNIDDIAEYVGFSDAANFRQAFKRWTNKAPSAYRGKPA